MKPGNKNQRRPGGASWLDKAIIFGAGVGVVGIFIYVLVRDGIPTFGELITNLLIRLAPAPSFFLIFFSCWYMGHTAYDLVVRLRNPQATEEDPNLQLNITLKNIKKFLLWYGAGVISLVFLYWWSPLIGLEVVLLAAIGIVTALAFMAGILARAFLAG